MNEPRPLHFVPFKKAWGRRGIPTPDVAARTSLAHAAVVERTDLPQLADLPHERALHLITSFPW